eukprot:scaffold289908_cov31-Tisochrysis_lutea.AAC.2
MKPPVGVARIRLGRNLGDGLRLSMLSGEAIRIKDLLESDDCIGNRGLPRSALRGVESGRKLEATKITVC